MPASCCCRKVGKSCVKGPLKPLPGRTPFLSPSPLVCILDQPRPSATSPPTPPLPGPQQLEVLRGPLSSVWRRQASPSPSICSLLPAADHRLGDPPCPVCTSASLAAILPLLLAPCSLLASLCAQPLCPAKTSARRYPQSQKGLDNVRTAGSDTAGTAASSLTRETQPTPFGDAD